jgi:uncharacterized protein (TIGR00369 family)
VAWQTPNPDYAAHVHRVFDEATFVGHLGITVAGVGPGWCESRLAVEPRHLQQNGFVHAGVQATLADHTAGGAALTVARADQGVLSIEFKINLLRPARGDTVRCRATLLRPGSLISVVESEVFADDTLTAKATVTLAIVQKQRAP